MSSESAKPQSGRFAVAMPNGHIWLETIRYRARDSRRAMGEILVGMRINGRKVETPEEGWAYALKRGYRVVKVDIIPQEPRHEQ